MNRRFTKGLQFGVVYTRSKAMDYAEGDSTTSPSGATNEVATYLNRRVWNYGLASYDRPNILTFHFLWDIPKLSRVVPNRAVRAIFDNWQLSDITSFISGAPLSITMETSPSVNFTGGGDGARPLMVANPNLPAGQRSFNQWFNLGAFAEPTPINPATCTSTGCPPVTIANIGDMPEMPIRGPGVNNWNTSLFKNFIVKRAFPLPIPGRGLQHVQPHSVFGRGHDDSVQRRGPEHPVYVGPDHQRSRPPDYAVCDAGDV